MYYIEFLRQLHRILEPRHYLEIGVSYGNSMTLSRCPSVGIDPAYRVERELHTQVDLFRTTSDEYFARPDPLEPTGGEPFDLAFIDGLHLFEFALRDFVHTERCSAPSSVIVFDDVLPNSVDEAARDRHTGNWTGDVYPILAVLAEHRPRLSTVLVDTRPTGLLLVVGLDPTDTVLSDHYDEILERHRHPDPQPVPDALLQRTAVQPPQRVLDAGFLQLLAGRPSDADRLRTDVRQNLVDALGPVFA